MPHIPVTEADPYKAWLAAVLERRWGRTIEAQSLELSRACFYAGAVWAANLAQHGRLELMMQELAEFAPKQGEAP